MSVGQWLKWCGWSPSREFGFPCEEHLNMQCDNQATIYIASNREFHEWTKYIKMDCDFIRDAVMSRKVCTFFTILKNQLVDIFTKPLDGNRFSILSYKLSMTNIYALIWGVLELM